MIGMTDLSSLSSLGYFSCKMEVRQLPTSQKAIAVWAAKEFQLLRGMQELEAEGIRCCPPNYQTEGLIQSLAHQLTTSTLLHTCQKAHLQALSQVKFQN